MLSLCDLHRYIWFEAATVVPVAPPVEMPTGSVLRSALAGGLASGLSTSLLHPVDTIKATIQHLYFSSCINMEQLVHFLNLLHWFTFENYDSVIIHFVD